MSEYMRNFSLKRNHMEIPALKIVMFKMEKFTGWA